MQKNKYAHQIQSQYLEYFIFALFALKSNFILPKKVSQLFLVLIFTQPLYFIFNFEKFDLQNQEYYVQFVGIILRPGYSVIQKFSPNHKYIFIFPLCFSLFQKVILTEFVFKIFKNNNKKFEGLLPQRQNSLILNTIYQLLNIFLQLNGSYIFLESFYLSLQSLKINLTQEIQYELLIFNLITIILIIVDCITTLLICETQITHLMSGIEKFQNSVLDIIYLVLLIAQIVLAIYFVGNTIKYFYYIFGLIQQIIILFGIFSQTTYILSYQKSAILISLAINTTFHTISLIYSIKEENFKILFLVIFFLLFNILRIYNKQSENSDLVMIFRNQNINEHQFLVSLMRLINNDFCSSGNIVMLAILIGQFHTQMKCVDKYCCYCNQKLILYTESSCAITTSMYNQFIQDQIEKLITSEQVSSQNRKQLLNQNGLHYAYFLYDRGQIIKSIKFLHSLFVRNEMYYKMNKNNILNQNEINIIYQMNANNFQQKINLIEKLKIKYIIEKGKSQIIAKFQESSLSAYQQSMIQDFIFNYIKNKQEIHLYEQKLVQVIQLKKIFFVNLLSSRDIQKKSEKKVSTNEDWFKLCSFIQQFQKLLKRSIKNQNQNNIRFVYIYSYFLGEILGDYYKAVHFFKTSKFGQLELIKFQQIKNFDINKKIEYIIMGLCEDFQDLYTKSYSELFFKTYGYKTSKNNEFSQLIPEFLQKVHFHHVNQFLLNGKDKYYNVFSINLITTPCNLLTTVNMCHTINNLATNNNLSFIIFIQDAPIDYIYLLIDDQSKRCYLTKNLLSLIGWSQQQINQLQEKNYLKNLKISFIFPNFYEQIDINSDREEFRILSAQLYFPHPNNNFMQIEQQLCQQPNKFIETEVITLECDILIVKKQVAQYKFFQVEIQNITNKLQDLYVNSTTSLNLNNENEFEFNLNDSQSDAKSELLINYEIKQTIVSASKMKFTLNAQQFDLEKICQEFGDKGTVSLPEQYSNLNSRRDQTIMQNDAQITQKMIKYQSESHYVLNDQIKINDERNEERIEQSEKINIQAKFNVLSNSDIIKDRIKQHHDLIGQIISLNAFKFVIKLISIITFWFMLFIIFIIFQYYNFVQDLSTCFSSIQITSFYSGIMSPHDVFFTMRITITAYQQMSREGFIPQDKLQQLIEPFQQSVALGFEEFKENFYTQLKNEILGQFINDINVSLYYMKENQTEIYPIQMSFRDSLFVILQYQYSQMMTLYYRKSTTNQPFQIFLFANYFQNHNKFEQIANEMYNYTLQFHSNLILKWCYIWISFLLGLLLFYGYLQYFQLAYFKQLDGFYKIIQYLSNQEIEREIKKLSSGQQLLSQNIQQIQKYNPETQLSQYQIHNPTSQKSQSRFHQIAQGVSYFQNSSIRLKNVTLFLFLLCLLLIFLCISVTQILNFYTKSRKTTQFYQDMLNMQLRPGNLYLYRETFLRWSNFTFLTEDDKDSLYRMINLAQQSIDTYIKQANEIDFSEYLVKNNFISMFNKINKDSFCFVIDEKFHSLYSKYCNLSFNGAINEGMIYALRYLSSQINTQQAMNNFTTRVEYELYELEGAQIISRVFFILNNQLMLSIKELYDEIQNSFKILTIVYVMLLAIIFYLMLVYYAPYLGRILKTIKRGVYLIPQESMLTNESMERKLKELRYKFY